MMMLSKAVVAVGNTRVFAAAICVRVGAAAAGSGVLQ
jgi:hypothetical protein